MYWNSPFGPVSLRRAEPHFLPRWLSSGECASKFTSSQTLTQRQVWAHNGHYQALRATVKTHSLPRCPVGGPAPGLTVEPSDRSGFQLGNQYRPGVHVA